MTCLPGQAEVVIEGKDNGMEPGDSGGVKQTGHGNSDWNGLMYQDDGYILRRLSRMIVVECPHAP